VDLSADGARVDYSEGIPVGGRTQTGQLYLNNHMHITVKYHSSASEYDGKRIVGFEVQPRSLAHAPTPGGPGLATCAPTGPVPGTPPLVLTGQDAAEHVYFTYDVTWEYSKVRWASRWDIYLSMGDKYPARVHWFSILNSFLIVVFLSVRCARGGG
jgi:transmembrane 9 superfamily protein 2/4